MSKQSETMADPEHEAIVGWFVGRLPSEWFESRPSFRIDRDEILIVGDIATPATSPEDSDTVVGAAISSAVDKFRKSTRKARVEIARDAEHRFERKVSWGVTCGGTEHLFTTLSSPAMTRLRMDERRVLDTLIDAGVARSRSEALAWCVKLVAANQQAWLSDLDQALRAVREARSSGPAV